MNCLQMLTIAVLLVCVGFTLAVSRPANDTEIASVQIKKAVFDGKKLSDPETTIELIIRQPGKRIVGVTNIKITKYSDDKGTDLNRIPEAMKGAVFPTRFQVGTQILFPVTTSVLPGAGATKLHLKGCVDLKIGTNVSSLQEEVKLTPNSNVSVGPFQIAQHTQNLKASETGVSVAYSDDILKSIHFFDKEKRSISYRRGGCGSSGGPCVNYRDYFVLSEKVEQIRVHIEYYSKSEIKTIPLDVEVGFGL